MARVVCYKCGAEADSKCPYCRNVFPDNQVEAMISHWMSISKEPREDDKDRSKLVIEMKIRDDAALEDEFRSLINVLAGMLESDGKVDNNHPYDKLPTFKQFMCQHSWKFAPGQKSEIQCGHDKTEVLRERS